jgi:hypothetical protein
MVTSALRSMRARCRPAGQPGSSRWATPNPMKSQRSISIALYRLSPRSRTRLLGLRSDKVGQDRGHRGAAKGLSALCRLSGGAIAANGGAWRRCLRFNPAQREIIQPAPDDVNRLLDRGKGAISPQDDICTASGARTVGGQSLELSEDLNAFLVAAQRSKRCFSISNVFLAM